MQVNRIQNNNYNSSPNFGALKITENGKNALLKAFNPEQLKQVAKWEKELESTKHFDLEVNAIMDELYYKFRHKTNPHLSSEGPLHSVEVKGQNLVACGVDLLDCGDWFYYNLTFPTAKEAGNAYATLASYKAACRPYRPNNFEDFNWAADSIKILDKSIKNTKSNKVTQVVEEHNVIPTEQPKVNVPAKPSFMKRLKNAWKALKGN